MTRAAINVGFADAHPQLVKVKDLWSLYWHDGWAGDGAASVTVERNCMPTTAASPNPQ